MSLRTRATATLVALLAAAAAATAAPAPAHADETISPNSLRVRQTAPAAPAASPAEPSAATTARADRVQLVLAGSLGLTALDGQLGARYRWLEIDLGLREYTDATEKYGGAKLLLHPDGPLVPYAYAQIGQWTSTIALDAIVPSDRPQADGLMYSGGVGIEAPMGRTATLFLHLGVDREEDQESRPNRVDAGVGFALRL